MEEENYVGEKVLAEAKTFQFFPHKEGFILRELHKRGERELFLTEQQSGWIAKGLKSRSKLFGHNKRREAIVMDGLAVVLIEGSNQKGIYMSIQIKEAGKESRFVVLPAGNKGRHWNRVSTMIGSVRQENQNRVVYSNSNRNQKTGPKTYANSVREAAMVETGDATIKLLQRKLEILEKEVALLRSQVDTAAKSDIREEQRIGNSTEKVINQDASMVAKIPSFFARKKKRHPTDGKGPDLKVRINPNDSIDSVLFALCRRFFSDFSAYIQSDYEKDANILNEIHNEDAVLANEMMPITNASESGLSTSRVISREANSLSSSYTTGSEEEIEQNECTSRMQGEDEINRSLVEDETEKDEDDLDNHEIFWDDKYECYAHACGMRHDPLSNTYFAEIFGESDDLSCFYFVPEQNKLTLAHKGKRGAINKQILEENDWEWSSVSNSFRFPPDLLDLFRNKLVDNELCGM